MSLFFKRKYLTIYFDSLATEQKKLILYHIF